MPKVTINEIDQSRYVVSSQRAPLIALVPVIASWGDTESATLIQSETDYQTYFGNSLVNPIENDITRNYALNLVNSGVTLLAKRIKPYDGADAFVAGKSATLDDLTADMSIGVSPVKNTVSAYIDNRDTDNPIYYVQDNSLIGWERYNANAEKLPIYEYTDVTDETIASLKEGSLEVVDDTDITITAYQIVESTVEGALEVVAADTPDIDPATQISVEDTELVADLPDVAVGDYVKKITEDDPTKIKYSVVASSFPDIPKQNVIGKFVLLTSTYIQRAITDVPFTEGELVLTTSYKYSFSAKAKYFGSYGNNVGIRIFRTTSNSSDILSRSVTDSVTINTYIISRRTLSNTESEDDVINEYNVMDNSYVRTARLVDSITFRLDDLSLDNSINKIKNFIDDFNLLSNINIGRYDSQDTSPLTKDEYIEFITAILQLLNSNTFVLTNGKDYFVDDEENNIELLDTYKEPLVQFYNTLCGTNNVGDNSSMQDIVEFWDDFKDPYIYDFDFICASGFTNINVMDDADRPNMDPANVRLHTNMLKLANVRGDAVACLDTPKTYNHINMMYYFSNLSNSDMAYSFGTTHAPWCKIRDITSGNYISMPGSFIFLATIGTNLARNSETQIWYAPAGVARAATNLVVEPAYEIGSTILDEWQNSTDYKVRINPIMNILTYGYTIYGNATLMQDEDGYSKSALQSLGTRVLCNVVKKAIFSICVALTFEPNDYILWAKFKTKLSDVLEQMKVNGGLSDYQIVMDDTTVTDEDKNNLRVPGKVFISPTRPAEFFDIDFTITQAGVTFDESRSDVIG
jgi:hypothetical protein